MYAKTGFVIDSSMKRAVFLLVVADLPDEDDGLGLGVGLEALEGCR